MSYPCCAYYILYHLKILCQVVVVFILGKDKEMILTDWVGHIFSINRFDSPVARQKKTQIVS